jgi:L-amino acid N-acyltransferase YncA
MSGGCRMKGINIIDTNSDNILDYGVCGYKNIKREGYPEKINWLKERYKEGMRIKILHSEKDKTQGMIEYIPGEYCWRPVDAAGYMFIHCIFVGFKKDYKGKGYGSLMLDECIKDAKKEKMNGVATITRKGAFMANSELFEKNGFNKVDSAPPDFELWVKKFRSSAPNPKFKDDLNKNLNPYKKGLSIIRADQCPYTVKNVKEIVKVAEKKYKIKPNVINLKNHKEAQESPCPFGTFCIIYNGKILAHHPISNTRFKNIMEKELK